MIFGICRYSVSRPWLSPNVYNFNFQTVNLSKYLYRISFLGMCSLIINPTSWPGVRAHRTMASCTAAQLLLRSDRLRYGQWHRRMWPQACSWAAAHPIAREKRPQCQPINSSVGVSYENTDTVGTWVGSEANDSWHGESCGSIAPT